MATQPKQFPVIGVSGEIYAHVFENPAQGVERGLYWAISLDCEPVVMDGDSWDSGINCEWLQFPLGHWTELDGQTLPHGGITEASFYLAEHHPLWLTSLSLSRVDRSPMFRVQLSGTFDLCGFGDLDGTDYPISIDCMVRFAGVYVVPDNLTPRPGDSGAASEVVRRHIDLVGLSDPVWDRFRYVLEPDGLHAP